MTFSTLGAVRSFHDRPERQIFLPALRRDPGDRPEGRGAALDLLVFRARRPAVGARRAADGGFSSGKRSGTPRSPRQARRRSAGGLGREQGFSGFARPDGPDLLEFLTAPYRRSSPPSLDEQPRLSLEARRANHGFLTQPIARQALLAVAPEYDRFAPVLAKPVRRGLDALARGSLLQNYALAVAVARVAENPAELAAAVLAAADAEGEDEPPPGFAVVARGGAAADRGAAQTPAGGSIRRENRRRRAPPRPLAAQSHKLCANPANFGRFPPINCEPESRNYARSGRAAP